MKCQAVVYMQSAWYQWIYSFSSNPYWQGQLSSLSNTLSMTLISLRLALGLPVYILNLQPLPFTHMTYINDVHGIHAVACNGKGFQHQSSWLSLHNLLHSFIIGVKRKRREKYHIYQRMYDDPQWKFHTISHQSGDSIKRESLCI